MFQFIKKCFFVASTFLASANSMANKECKVRPEIVNVHSN